MNPLDALPRRRRAALWAAVLSGLLLAMLDQTIVGTALPRITRELDGGRWYVWTVTAYLVPATVLLPVAARLSDRHGRRRVLMIGMVLFVLGSVLCSAAASVPQLAGFRALQGAGAAALEALSFTLVAELSGPARRGAAQAALAGVMAVSLLAGPVLGGLLTDHVGWRSAFWVNVPVGLAALWVVGRHLPAGLGRSESRATPLDLAGIATLTLAVGAVLVGLQRHLEVPSWWAPSTGGLVLAGVLGLGLLVLVERRAAAPVLPPALLGDRTIGAVVLAGATMTFALYACVLLLPRYFQLVRGASATGSGVEMYPLLVGMLVGVNVGATLLGRGGSVRGVLLGGAGLVATGALVLARLEPGSGRLVPLVGLALVGLGLGPALSGAQIVISRAVPPERHGAAMGALLLARQVGGVVALAVAESLHSAHLAAGAPEASAAGDAVAVVALVGAGVAALALLALPRGAGRPAPVPGPQAVPAGG